MPTFQFCVPVRYRLVPGWPDYMVGDDGSVWSNKYGKCVRLKQSPRNGYLFVVLYKDGTRWQVNVNVLILLTFVGPCPPGLESCHEDDIKTNNALVNLRWDTRSENRHDGIRNGTFCSNVGIGSDNINAILTPDLVRWIRSLPKSVTGAEIARQLGCGKATVSNARRGLSWKHVT